jgi:hypothetical protein
VTLSSGKLGTFALEKKSQPATHALAKQEYDCCDLAYWYSYWESLEPPELCLKEHREIDEVPWIEEINGTRRMSVVEISFQQEICLRISEEEKPQMLVEHRHQPGKAIDVLQMIRQRAFGRVHIHVARDF